MIKKVPNSLNMPNYKVNFGFDFTPREKTKDECGEISIEFLPKDFTVRICPGDKPAEETFLLFLYCTSVIGALTTAYDLTINATRLYGLGMFLYHLMQNNDMRKLFKTFKKKNAFAPFEVSVPSFVLKVESHNSSESPLGSIDIPRQLIQIYQESDYNLKNVILIHELIEWCNISLKLGLKHLEIQVISEGLAYIINNNEILCS